MSEINNLRIVFFGTPEFILPVCEKLASHFDLAGVVTSPDAPAGRNNVVTPSPVKVWYMDYLLNHNKEGIILTPDHLTDDTAIKLRKLHPDLFVVAAYGKIVPKSILDIPRYGSINVHPSNLPNYRGPSPIQTALIRGDRALGISLMLMDEQLDHGPILYQWDIPITQNDTFETLHTKSFLEAAGKLPDVINQLLQHTIIPQKQDDTRATFTQKITKQDGYFDINNPPSPEKLQNMIRAFYPWPTVWTKINMKNLPVDRQDNDSKIMKFLPNGYVQIEGKTPTKIKDLLNGYPEITEVIKNLGIDR